MRQSTLKRKYTFEGKGLHSGRVAHMTLCPAPPDTGIRFHRVDMGPDAFVDAVAENVSSTARSTTISCGKVSVGTIEHLLSAFTGLGIDNVLVEIDSPEVPILDGSARLYVEAIAPDGVELQAAERKYVELKDEVVVEDKRSGSRIVLTPSDSEEMEVTIDFNSRVLGVQTVAWSPSVDYASQIGPCRTFCFLHEIQMLLALGLVKGGNVENAIVIVEKPISDKKLERLARRMKQPRLSVTPEGYLSNLVLNFPDECGRHKLLDLMGDLRLCGGFLKAKVTAYKPGHRLNTALAKNIRNIILNNG